MSSSPVRCVLVGDEGVGKTSLLISYTRNRFPEFYVPTILDNLAVNVEIRNKTYTLALFDTNPPNQSDQCLFYADVFLLCFSLNDLSSFQNVEKWHSIVKLKNSTAKVILVGMKSDLREDSEKGDAKVQFSGQQRQLLRNLKSYFHEILHDGQLFGVLSGNVESLAIQPPWRLFWNTTLSAEKKFMKYICAQKLPTL